MKACFWLMVLGLCAFSSFAQHSTVGKQAAAAYAKPEKQDVDYVKSLDVKTLDPSLPSQRLEDWLRSGPPHVESLEWLYDPTCDNKEDSSDTEYPRCVRIQFGRGGQSGYLLVLIGTLKKGIIGPPKLYEGIGVQEEVFVQTGWTEHLSGLPHLLDQPPIAPVVRHLFDEVVVRHPIGIPTGADKAAIFPFLSKRLSDQLETAQACQDDYLRQHPQANASPKPGWINSGIFVGEGKREIPFSENVTHLELQKDGSPWVSVALTYDKAWVNRGGGFTPDHMWWAVTASVVPENNRFVVDDVRLFDGLDTSGPSHLLSESFSGCNGPHWTGEHVENRPPIALPPPHYTDWAAVNVLRGAANKEEVAFVRTVDIHQLDPSLPSQHLEGWLNSAALHLNHIEWHALGCNIKEGRDEATPTPEGGLCGGVWFQHGNARVDIRVKITGKGISRAPKVEYIGVTDKDGGLLTPVFDSREKASDSDRLSDLPRLLNEESVIDVTRNLYETVIARHSLGIPQGQDKVRIAPLLSKRLRQQLATAQTCRADYLHQNPAAGTPKPAWLNAGLFSGEGSLALPGAELVDHKERHSDGSFRVFVWLSHKNSAAPVSALPASPWRNWHVVATVKSEDGHSVVDDIRLFDDDSSDSPSRLLSNSFLGCDGTHWIGTTPR